MADPLFLTQDDKYRAISTQPSLNLTPMGPVSVPCGYPVVSDLGEALECVASVRFNGKPVYVLGQSRQKECKGDETGSDKGVRSGTVNGEVKPTKASSTVNAGGKPIVRVGDTCTMQGGNTVGVYVANVAPGPAPPPDAPVPSRTPPVVPETAQEAAFQASQEAPPAPAPPPPAPAPGPTLWQRVEALLRKGMSDREFLFQAALGMFKKAGNDFLQALATHLHILLAPLVERLWKKRSDDILEGLQPGPVPFRNVVQEYGASHLLGMTKGMVVGALFKEIPNLAKHPLLDWGPGLWRTAKPLVPKKVVQNLDHLMEKARGKLFGPPKAPAKPEPPSGTPAPPPAFPNPGDGGVVLPREVFVAKAAPLTLEDKLFQEGHGPLNPEGAEQVRAEQEAEGASTVRLSRGDLLPEGMPAAPPAAVPDYYTARRGDSAWAIAAKQNPGASNETINAYKNKLLAENPGLGNSNLRPGDRVRLPGPETREDVARGRVLDGEMESRRMAAKQAESAAVREPSGLDAVEGPRAQGNQISQATPSNRFAIPKGLEKDSKPTGWDDLKRMFGGAWRGSERLNPGYRDPFAEMNLEQGTLANPKAPDPEIVKAQLRRQIGEMGGALAGATTSKASGRWVQPLNRGASLGRLSADRTPSYQQYLFERHHRTGNLNLDITARGRREMVQNYFEKQGLDPQKIKQHMNGIDFTKDVDLFPLNPNQQVLQWQAPGKSVGNYFAPMGSEPHELGINPFGRKMLIYSPKKRTTVLRSSSAEIIDGWTQPSKPFRAKGGEIQYYTADPSQFTDIKPGKGK